MRNLSQKELGKGIIQIHNIIDLIDDGYHNKDIQNLVKISNELFDKLTPENQKKCEVYLEKRHHSNLN